MSTNSSRHKDETVPAWKSKGITIFSDKNKHHHRFPVSDFFNGSKPDDQLLGPGYGAGIGCGVGIGIGVVGGIGIGDYPWNHLKMAFGLGLGCGVGFGFGFGQGFGYGNSFDYLKSRFNKHKYDSKKKRIVIEI